LKSPQNIGFNILHLQAVYSSFLLAVWDAKYKFACVDRGEYRKQSDDGIFMGSKLYQFLENTKFELPKHVIILQPDIMPLLRVLLGNET
jgi:hypothetical protein